MIGATTTTASAATSILSHLDQRMHSHQLLATASDFVDMHSDLSLVSSQGDFSPRTVTDQPQETLDTNDNDYDYDYDYDYDSDSDLDSSSDLWSDDEYDESSPGTTHLIADNGTLRLPSGKIISARSAAASPQTHQFRRNRKPLPPRPTKPNVGRARPPTPDETRRQAASPPNSTQTQDQPAAEPESPPPSFLSRREEKRYQTFTVRRAELRRTDLQSLAGLPLTQQQALLATTHKQIEQAERSEKRFTGKMDQLGNIKISERFVNDVPGGKAHKNRFFAR